MNRDQFFKFDSFKEYKSQSYAIKKMCDYVQLFAAVNRELVDDHLSKKAMGKKTRRYKISSNFIKVTETLEKIKDCLENICVKPLI